MLKPLTTSQRESLERAASDFQEALTGDTVAVAYLEARGIDPVSEDLAPFRLGVVPDGYPGFERFAGRVSIPNVNASNRVVGLKFRSVVPDDGPKYDQPDGQRAGLYNLRAVNTDQDWIAVTEGELDTVSLAVVGIDAVGVPGSNGWKAHHHLILEGFRRVILVRDADDGGKPLVAELLRTPLDVAVVRPPGGHKDVNDALVAGLGAEMRETIEKAAK